MQTLRYWEYYNMTDTFTELYERAKQGEKFNRLYDVIISRENILLAFRTIKSNKGSQTAGTDGNTIDDIRNMTDNKLVETIQLKLKNYQPKTVRRVYIPKSNGDKRPLGIPSMMDRLIQQCFKQILEPIAEAKFYKHSYGFRPLRSTHNAIARAQHLINHNRLHYVVDIDIKGFFDNINHTKLLKQLWNMGIQDRKVLRIISKMLKAKIEQEGVPTKGTPQGGILSPLLSNVVLNDLDQWVKRQWENFPSQFPYKNNCVKYTALKKTKLKEGYIVRYADDFKIFCRDWKTAQKWFYAVKLYLKDRLNLDISTEKSQIINLRKRQSEFLGFTIKAVAKGNKRVAHTGIREKKKQQIKQQYKEYIKRIQQSPTAENARLFNSFIMGIHNYFSKATHVNIEFSRIAYDLSRYIYNRLKRIAKYEHPREPPKTYQKYYSIGFRTYKIAGEYLFPIADVKTSNSLNFSQKLNVFTGEGRELIYTKLKGSIQHELSKLLNSRILDKSTEYLDNRLSRYSMKMGKCEITKQFLTAEEVHCHHYLPLSQGGNDRFDNLRIIHKELHKLIHSTKRETIIELIKSLKLTEIEVKKINQYRKMSNLESIEEVLIRWNAVCDENGMHGVEEGKRWR